MSDSSNSVKPAENSDRKKFGPSRLRALTAVFIVVITVSAVAATGVSIFDNKSSAGLRTNTEHSIQIERRPDSLDNDQGFRSQKVSFVNQIQTKTTPTPKPLKEFRVKGYVVDRDNRPLGSIILIVTNKSARFERKTIESGKFSIKLPPGDYVFEVRDPEGNYSSYQGLSVDSDTSIKFVFSGRKEAAKPIPTPTNTPYPTPYPTIDPEPFVSPTPPRPTPTVTPGPGPKPSPPKPTPTPDDEGTDGGNDNGGRNDNSSNSGGNSNSNGGTNTNGNASIGNTNSNGNDNSADSSDENDAGGQVKPGFFSTTPGQLTIAGLGFALLGLLAWLWPFLSLLPGMLAGFLAGFGAAGTMAEGDDVHCTLYSQPEVNAGTDLLVQVYAHLLEQADELDELAQELDPDAKKAISKALKRKIKQNSVLTFKLMVPGIELDEVEQDVVWRGEPEAVEFIIPIPAEHPAGNRFGRIFVYNNGDEIGKIPFRINIVPFAKQLTPEAATPEIAGILTQDQTAFVSYASRDKDKVYRFVQLMDVLKYKYHIDIFNIEAGDRWEQKLYEFIGADDVFLLFWSEAASESEWVIKEAQLAKDRMEKEQLPRIVIYSLDGKVQVPDWLQDIHVDRKWAEIIGAVEAEQ